MKNEKIKKDENIYLKVIFSNGDTFEIQGSVIARNRAEYYAKEDPDTTYQLEYEFTLHDDYELEDWAKNNMNWEDVEYFAKKVPSQIIDYNDEWTNCENEIINKESE